MWSYTAGGLKGSVVRKIEFQNQTGWSHNQGGLKIKGCKIGGLLYFMYYDRVGIYVNRERWKAIPNTK